MFIQVSCPVCEAYSSHRPIVALETTIMTHGLPKPHGLQTALDCEEVVRRQGATPATTAVIDGKLVVGVDAAQFERLASDTGAAKTNLGNIAAVIAARGNGSTSVSTTLLAANYAGIRVAATGGIGGVHRHYAEHLDISSDLTALERYPVVLVCAGAKNILDVPATREQLETRGIPVIGYRTDHFPLFYSRGENISVDARLDEPEAIARAFAAHLALGNTSAMLVVADPPADEALPYKDLNQLIEDAVGEARVREIHGRAVTPFVLDRLREMTGGATLKTNLALIRNNCEIAAQIAVEMMKHGKR